MRSTPDATTFAALLTEATHGSIMGVRIGDSGEALRGRLGDPDGVGHVGRFVVYQPAEFSLGDDGTVQMIYVEVPDEIVLRSDAVGAVSACSASPDPEVLIAQLGAARLCLDRGSLRVISFAL